MSNPTTKKEKEVILVIADISGYSRFMMDNKTTLLHAQTVITNLMNTIIKHVKIPLKISKFEGDAVFLYAIKRGGGISWEERKKRIRERIHLFIDEFTQKATELAQSNTCKCNACSMIEKLKLKIIIHSGTTLFYKIDKFYELSGTDVITVHRLLKNSIGENEYIMFTDRAYMDLEIPRELKVEAGFENYDDIGAVNTVIHYPNGKTGRQATEEETKKYSSGFYKMKNMMIKMFTMMMLTLGIKKKSFKHIPEPGPQDSNPERSHEHSHENEDAHEK